MPVPASKQNHTWIKPYELTSGTAIEDVIVRPYQSTWYVLHGLHPGDDVSVTLTGCAVDYTLLGYVDIRAKALALLKTAQTGAPTREQLRRFLAGDVAADDMESDDMESDDMESDDMESDDMESDDMESDDMESDDMESDDMESDDMESEDWDNDGNADWQQFSDVYATAQRRALRAASVTLGVADEVVQMTVRGTGGDLYFRVRGHHGVCAPDDAFTITPVVTPSNVCAGARLDLPPLTPPAISGKKTLILTNTARPSLGIAAPNADPNARGAFLRKLRELERATNGYVHDLANDTVARAYYDAWDAAPRCIPQANLLVDAIRVLIAALARENPLEYVVIAGADDVIPFRRLADGSDIARESQWGGPYRFETALEATLVQDFYLSDDPYGADEPVLKSGEEIYLPTRAVGRLVESADDITRHVDWFVAQSGSWLWGRFFPKPATIQLQSALVSGYSFVADLAGAMTTRLRQTGVTNVDATLIKDPVTNVPNWSADDLRRKLFGGLAPGSGPAPHYDLIAVEGHYRPSAHVPADDGERFRSEELVAVHDTSLNGTLWATMGCHSGHDIVDLEATPYAQPKSFVETLLARGATVVAGTGYQYAESILLKNSEELYRVFLEELTCDTDLAGEPYRDDVSVGHALANAKRRYLDGLHEVHGMHQKLIGVATLYGLPMLRLHVRTRQPRTAAPAPAAPAPTPLRTAGLQRATITLSKIQTTRVDTKDGTYFTVGGQIVATPRKPILPAVFSDITVPGTVATGAIWLEGTYTTIEKPLVTPLIARPVTERDPKPLPYNNRAYLPLRPLRLARSGGANDRFVFAPLQYAWTNGRSGTVRTWQDATFYAYYSSRTDRGALRDAPELYAPLIERIPDGLRVTIEIRHRSGAGEEVDAYATYLVGGALHSARLTGSESWRDGNGWIRHFRGEITGIPQTTGFFFQAVGDNGHVGVLSNGGELFAYEAPGVRALANLAFDPVPAAQLSHRDRIEVRAALRDANKNPIVGGEVLFRLGRSRVWTKTDADGRASATLTVAVKPRLTADGVTYRTDHRIVASFIGTPADRAAAVARPITVRRAGTEIVVSSTDLQHKRREVVGTLSAVADGGGRRIPLGDRLVTVTRGESEQQIYTDPDGTIRLEPRDIDLKEGREAVQLTFHGDARYEPSETKASLTVSAPK